MTKEWYVVHTFTGQEQRIKEYIYELADVQGIREDVGEIVIPKDNRVRMRNGKKEVMSRKSMPGYIIVEAEMTSEIYHLIKTINGVTHILGSGDTPIPLSEEEVKRLKGEEEKDVVMNSDMFKYGETVKIIDGPFNDFSGVVEEINSEKGRLKVIVTIFGRPIPVEVDFLQVEKLD